MEISIEMNRKQLKIEIKKLIPLVTNRSAISIHLASLFLSDFVTSKTFDTTIDVEIEER